MALEDDLRLFRQISIFRLLEPDALRLLAFSAETKLLRAGDVLLRAPGPVDGGRLLTHGSLAVFNNNDQLGAPTHILAAPTLIGEIALICETDQVGSVVAREPSTIFFIARALFHRILLEYPRSAEAIRKALTGRVVTLAGQIAPLATS